MTIKKGSYVKLEHPKSGTCMGFVEHSTKARLCILFKLQGMLKVFDSQGLRRTPEQMVEALKVEVIEDPSTLPEDVLALGYKIKPPAVVEFQFEGVKRRGRVIKAGTTLSVALSAHQVLSISSAAVEVVCDSQDPAMPEWRVIAYKQDLRQSRETACFVATIEHKGNPVIEASNGGGGEATIFRALPKAPPGIVREYMDAVSNWVSLTTGGATAIEPEDSWIEYDWFVRPAGGQAAEVLVLRTH